MRTVGQRKERQISFHGSGELLAEGARFNDELQRLPGGKLGLMPKGVYFFKTHAEANRQQEECLALAMAELTMNRQRNE